MLFVYRAGVWTQGHAHSKQGLSLNYDRPPWPVGEHLLMLIGMKTTIFTFVWTLNWMCTGRIYLLFSIA